MGRSRGMVERITSTPVLNGGLSSRCPLLAKSRHLGDANINRFAPSADGRLQSVPDTNPDTFYENVDDGKGGNKKIQSRPRTGEPTLVACLWSKWADPAGVEPDPYSFAAVTDNPEPEVAAAGHDRTIVNLKPESVEAGLTPKGRGNEELMALLDDKRHPFYEAVHGSGVAARGRYRNHRRPRDCQCCSRRAGQLLAAVN